MQQVLALAFESSCAVGHDALALGCANLSAEICLARLAELAFFAFRRASNSSVRVAAREDSNILEGYNIVSNLDRRYALADGLDDASSFVSKNNRKGALGVLARECVRI